MKRPLAHPHKQGPDLGITGTKQGWTLEQKAEVVRILQEWAPARLHHGLCIGVDCQTHKLARALGWRHRGGFWIVGHPPSDTKLVCHGIEDDCDELFPAEPYLARNRTMVDSVQGLIVVPYEPEEIRRSGTWATLRYARSIGRDLELVLPERRP